MFKLDSQGVPFQGVVSALDSVNAGLYKGNTSEYKGIICSVGTV